MPIWLKACFAVELQQLSLVVAQLFLVVCDKGHILIS